MTKRPREVLINPTWEEMVEREPLLAFSFYLLGRVNVLLGIADEIVEHLDQGICLRVCSAYQGRRSRPTRGFLRSRAKS